MYKPFHSSFLYVHVVAYVFQFKVHCDKNHTHTEINTPLELKYKSCSNVQALNILPKILSPPFPHYLHIVTTQHGTLSHCTNKRLSYFQTPPQRSPQKSNKHGLEDGEDSFWGGFAKQSTTLDLALAYPLS